MSLYIHKRSTDTRDHISSICVNLHRMGFGCFEEKHGTKMITVGGICFLALEVQCFYQFEILRVSLLNSWGVHRHVKTCWGHGLHAGSRQPLPHVPQRPLHEGADSRAEGQHGRSQALVRGGPVHQPDSCQDHAETGKTLCPPPACLQCPHTLTGFVCFYVITYSLPGRLNLTWGEQVCFLFSVCSVCPCHSFTHVGRPETNRPADGESNTQKFSPVTARQWHLKADQYLSSQCVHLTRVQIKMFSCIWRLLTICVVGILAWKLDFVLVIVGKVSSLHVCLQEKDGVVEHAYKENWLFLQFIQLS